MILVHTVVISSYFKDWIIFPGVTKEIHVSPHVYSANGLTCHVKGSKQLWHSLLPVFILRWEKMSRNQKLKTNIISFWVRNASSDLTHLHNDIVLLLLSFESHGLKFGKKLKAQNILWKGVLLKPCVWMLALGPGYPLTTSKLTTFSTSLLDDEHSRIGL